jgi:hypothetical protein
MILRKTETPSRVGAAATQAYMGFATSFFDVDRNTLVNCTGATILQGGKPLSDLLEGLTMGGALEFLVFIFGLGTF